jgi:protein-disulfide isomerase
MNKDVLRLIGIGVVLLAGLGLAMTLYQSGANEEEQEQARKVFENQDLLIRPHSQRQGPANAEVTVVEFLDPECETCRVMYPYVKRIQAEYGDRLRLVIRYMPYHRNSVYAAGALEAAGAQGRYWDFLELLFINQPAWGDHHNPRPDLIPELARQMGLDMQAFQKYLDAGAFRDLVEIDRKDGETVGVKGTPTFFINGRMLETLGYEPLKALIDEELRGS